MPSGLTTALPSPAGYVLLPLVCFSLIFAPARPWAARPWRALTDAERRRAERVLGRPVRRPCPTPEGTAYQRTLQLLRSPVAVAMRLAPADRRFDPRPTTAPRSPSRRPPASRSPGF
ncbi:sensor domain-containing protein [Streptomyces tanashiensis]|uniref:sensor domain-containing protein n=1 Tax=Streptomyces tanashiensis TaxID=67367 RepID=UPI0034434B3B